MKKITFYLILVILLEIKCFEVKEDYHWDFFRLCQAWPPAFCSFNKCRYPSNYTGWNIHGLWPTALKGKSPAYCPNSTAFNIGSLMVIYDELKESWMNLKRYDKPKQLWFHEWTAHGRCATDNPLTSDELHYFNNSMQIKKQLNIEKILDANGIKPHNTTKYNESFVHKILKEAIGYNVSLRCFQTKKANLTIWLETRVCVTRDFKLMDCPPRDDDQLSTSSSSADRDLLLFRNQKELEEELQAPSPDYSDPCPSEFLFIPHPVPD